MKIGILTFHYAINYGAVLQAYATQTWLFKQGIDAYIINYIPVFQAAKYRPKLIGQNYLADFQKKPFLSIARWLRYKLLIEKDYIEKTIKFDEFLKRNIKMTPIMRNISELYDLNNDGYFAFLCGSDQIWNPEITRGFDKTYFCGFANNNVKKISYAASAADIEVLNKEEKKQVFFDLIKNFNYIGVREQSLAEFISSKLNINSVVTLDPTLLLEKEDYDKITVSRENINRDYLLIYQLARNPKAKEVAIKIAKKRNLEIIEVCGTFYNKPHSKNMICNAGPSEFLGLIRNASYVITNSFHGTIFSIIYRKNFNSILSKKGNSRIIDLLKSLELKNRIITSTEHFVNSDAIDYSKHQELLEEMKVRSINYLKNSIGIKNE